MKMKLVLVALAAMFLGGCAATVHRAPATAATRVILSADKQQVSGVTLTLTEEGKKKALGNLKFNTDELLNHVKRALATHSLLNASSDQSRPSLEIQVKSVRMRSTFTAFMWGPMAGADQVTADVVVKDQSGNVLDRFEVSVSIALGGYYALNDSRTSWLYEKFAEQTVKELVGPAVKPAAVARD